MRAARMAAGRLGGGMVAGGPEARRQAAYPGILRYLSLSLGIAILSFVGCHTAGPAARETQAESVAALLDGLAGADAAVDALADGKDAAEVDRLNLKAELDLREDAEAIPEWDAEGKPLSRLLVPLDALVRVDADGNQVGGLLVELDEGRRKIREARERFYRGYDEPVYDQDGKPVLRPDGTPETRHVPGWLESRSNFADALRLQEDIRRLLERSGIEPEDIEGFMRGMSSAIERGR